ncbi:MAG: hypothetical protein QW153_03545 [Candidatus Bilamarchaeaceae archaeon]
MKYILNEDKEKKWEAMSFLMLALGWNDFKMVYANDDRISFAKKQDDEEFIINFNLRKY